MFNHVDFIWAALVKVFNDFLLNVSLAGLPVSYKISATSNSSFLLRGFLSFMGNRDGDEVAITVDVTLANGVFKIETDAVKDDGSVIAEGPKLICDFVNWDSILADFDGYARKVGKFLAEEEAAIYREVTRLE